MSAGMIFGIVVVGMFPALILVAAIVKYRETRIARTWPETPGKIVASRVEARKIMPGEIGYNFSDTDVRNFPPIGDE
jgi:hypothetical protein